MGQRKTVRPKTLPDAPMSGAPAECGPEHQMGNAEMQRQMVERQALTGLPVGHRELGNTGMQSVDIRADGGDFNILEMEASADGSRAVGPHIRASVGNLSRDGGHQYGARLEGGLAQVQLGEEEDFGVDMNVAQGGIEASIGDQGATFGEDFTAMEAEGRARFEDAGDTRVEYGLGASGSLGGRLHWADTDGDGLREIGAGLSVGPVRVDMTNEWLGGLLADWL